MKLNDTHHRRAAACYFITRLVCAPLPVGRKMHCSILLTITKFGVAAQWEGTFSLDIYALNWVQFVQISGTRS